jgi:UDP-N-acetylmuramoylalanine--D-glutamate ligase
MANAVEEDDVPKRKSKNQLAIELEVTVARLMPADALKIRGTHNAINALAALALCRAINLPMAPLLHGLREYQGEPHRVEFIANIHQVDYYDDSKGTNVYATVAAINGLAKPSSKIWLIAGGLGKGQDFTPLRDPVAQSVSAVFLIGQATEEIAQALAGNGVELIRCTTLEQAVSAAAAKAQPGDIVLLSPACASFDMFKGYAHRGQVFVDAVKEIGLEHGEVML